MADAAAVTGTLANAGRNAAVLANQNARTDSGGQASAFDVWSHTAEGLSQERSPGDALLHGTPAGAAVGVYRGLTRPPVSADAGAVGDAIVGQAGEVGKSFGRIAEAQGALATVGATFEMLVGIEQMISAPLSLIPFPAFPALRIMDMDVGLPHGHAHPPTFGAPLPSTGPVIPIPLLSGAMRTLINGMPAARCGDMGLGVWCGGYFPMFEIFLGSSSVWIEGCRAARTGVDITNHCIFTARPKPGDPPVGPFVGTTYTGSPNVIIGGVPMPMLLNFAMGAAFRGLGKLMGAGARAFRRAASKLGRRLGRNMRPGFVKCRVLRAEPVDSTTGEVVVEQSDFALSSRIPLDWTRSYRSHNRRRGSCGIGWETPADARLEFEPGGMVVFHNGRTGAAIFESLPHEVPVRELVDGAVLDKDGDQLIVCTKGGLVYHFPRPGESSAEVLVQRVTDRCGNSMSFVRNSDGLKEIIESSGVRVEVISHRGLIAQMLLRHPAETETRSLVRYEYAEAGDLLVVYDQLEASHRFEYQSHCLVRHTDRKGLSFQYEYDGASPEKRCTRAWGDNGLYDYRFEYLPALNQTRIIDSLGHVTTLVIGVHGLPVKEINPLGEEITYQYDYVGRTTAVTDPAGNRTEYEYDENGNTLRITRPDGAVLTTAYNSMHLPVTEIDAAGNVWEYEWDVRGKFSLRRSPRGGKWTYDYNDRGDLVAATDPLGATTRFQVNDFGETVAVEDALGHVTRYELDVYGNTVSRTDALGQTTRYRYNKRSRLIEVRKPSGSSVAYTYDGEDNLISFRAENGHVTSYRYVGLGEVAAKINADGTRLLFEYDTEERLTALVNERGERYVIERDALGRVTKEIDYWANTWAYRYDAAGNVVEITDPLERTTRLAYDPLGRLVERRLFDGEVETFAYDPNGNITGVENGAASITRQFDEEGNIIQEVQGDVVVTSEYDLNGNRTARISSPGHELRVEYDPLGNAISMTVDGRPLAESRYDPLDRLAQETLLGDLRREVSWDPDGRVAEQRLSRHASPIVTRQYHYDPTGNLRERIDANKGRTAFEYDSLGRVRRYIDSDNRIRELSHDPSGDLLTQVRNTGSGNGGGRDTVRILRHAETRYHFDRAGNLLRRESLRGVATFEWDGLNRLRTATNESGQLITFGYDPLGRRVFKEVDDIRTRFVWDGGVLLSDEMTGEPRREFIFRPDSFEPFASLNGRLYVYETDPSGLPHELVAQDGGLVWSARYGPFGNVTEIGKSEEDNPLRFLGQYYDNETELCYSRFRYYDPQTRAFITQDPLGLEAGHNLYAYAPNVWHWVDPIGLSCFQWNRGVQFSWGGRWRVRLFHLAPGGRFDILVVRNILRFEVHPISRRLPQWLRLPHVHLDYFPSLRHVHLPWEFRRGQLNRFLDRIGL